MTALARITEMETALTPLGAERIEVVEVQYPAPGG